MVLTLLFSAAVNATEYDPEDVLDSTSCCSPEFRAAPIIPRTITVPKIIPIPIPTFFNFPVGFYSKTMN